MSGVVPSALVSPVSPEGMLQPGMRAIWLPLSTGTSALTGGTSPNGFANAGNLGATTKDITATVTVTSGTALSWAATGGLVFGAGNYYLTASSSDPDIDTWMSTMLDTHSLLADQTLMVGCVLTTPVGYSAANTGTVCMLSVGDLSAGGHGLSFQHTSIEAPHLLLWPKGAADSFTATVPALWGNIADATPTAIVWEMKSEGGGQFRLRGHRATSAGVVSTAWTASQNFAAGGTEAPGMPSGTGIRIGGRRNGATNSARMQDGQKIQGVCLLRFDSLPPTDLAQRIALDLVTYPDRFSVTARRYQTEDEELDYEPDGNADETFGDITMGDMHIALNGKRSIGAHPSFSVHIEPMLGKRSVALAAQPQWVSTSTYEGITRFADPPGGLKVGRTTLSPASEEYPAFVASTYGNPGAGLYPADQTNRNREEIGWRGPLVWLPRQQPMWIAGRYYYDFDIEALGGQHLTLLQLFHAANGAGLNPPFDVSLFADKWSINIRHSSVAGMVKTDQSQTNYSLPGKFAEMRGAWFDLVVYCNVSWDPSHNGFVKVYVNDALVVNHSGPLGYKGPTANGRTPAEQIHTGAYPGIASYWTPDAVRNVYIRRFFSCRDVGNYTLAQIRQALVA